MKVSPEIWLLAGYETFALSGVKNLKIEQLAKKVGISKSSFYHHFADLDCFVEQLLKKHLEQSELISEKEKNAQNIDPELIEILIEHRIDLLFNRQLRVEKNVNSFNLCLKKSNEIIGNSFIQLWTKDMNLTLNEQQINALYTLALENFYLEINPSSINKTFLSAYFQNLKKIALQFSLEK